MKPPGKPSPERDETHQITSWNIAQRRLQGNKYTPGSRYSNIYPKTKTAKRRPKLGGKKQKGQLTMHEALGQAPKANHEPEQNATTRDDKKFGNKLEPKKKLLFRCATHNINNIPEASWTAKSK